MKLSLKVVVDYDVKYLQVEAGVRYWEDASVDGVKDVNGDLIPCRVGDDWCPLIELETGKIVNWNKGVTAKTHYKVCDDGRYSLLGEDKVLITEHEGYVLDMLNPQGGGYGDYIVMSIDENGYIDSFGADFEEFTRDKE